MSSLGAGTVRPCHCTTSIARMLSEGNEGSAVLHHGSYVRMGCLQFVFTVCDHQDECSGDGDETEARTDDEPKEEVKKEEEEVTAEPRENGVADDKKADGEDMEVDKRREEAKGENKNAEVTTETNGMPETTTPSAAKVEQPAVESPKTTEMKPAATRKPAQKRKPKPTKRDEQQQKLKQQQLNDQEDQQQQQPHQQKRKQLIVVQK